MLLNHWYVYDGDAPPPGVVPVRLLKRVPWQMVWSAATVLPVMEGSMVMVTGVLMSVQAPELTIL
ncbi:MAG: hypothetical protein U5L72_07165 [Bacteroidales bacterium]|nr:hypothetical protein [Bacteroidales bacterium]